VKIARGARAAEAWLLAELGELCEKAREDPRRLAEPVHVVVPSRSLREHVAAAIVRHFGRPVTGVKLHTLHGLALEICDRGGAPNLPRGELLFPIVVRQQAREEPALSECLDALDDGYGAVTAVITDLLDAGFDAAGVAEIAKLAAESGGAEARRAQALVRVADRSTRALESSGTGHRSALLRRARASLEADPRAALPARAVFVHGFAEATGVGIELIEALVHLRGAQVLLDHPPDPAGAERPTPGIAFTKRLRDRLAPAGAVEIVGTREQTQNRIRLLCAPGADAEVRGVADRVRALLDGGAEPERIGVVARHLGMYRLPIRRQFGRLGIPFSGAPGTAGPTHPRARRAGAVTDVMLRRGDVIAERWIDAVDSLSIRDSHEREGNRWRRLRGSLRADLRIGLHALGAARLRDVAQIPVDTVLDRSGNLPLPVRRGVVSDRPEGGEDEASGDQARATRRRLPGVVLRATVDAARALLARLESWPERAGVDVHLGHLRAALDRDLGHPRDGDAARAIADKLAAIEREAPEDFALSVVEFALVLRRAFAEIGTTPLGGEGAGVGVLDVTAARGRTFEHLFVLGMNRDVFPRAVVEDPLLSDDLRRSLSARLPDLPIKETGYEEERYLFSQLVSAAPNLTLSWQFVDADGRERSRSPLLERLCSERALEADRVKSLTARPTAGFGGPLRPAAEHALLSGLYGTREQFGKVLSVALSETRSSLLASRSDIDPAALASARMAVLDEFDPDRRTDEGRARMHSLGPYYGFLGRVVDRADPRRSPLFVTTVQGMASCPWRTFLEKLLRLAPTPDALDVLPAVDPLLIGTVVHRVLERVARAGAEADAAACSLPDVRAREPRPTRWPSREEVERILAGVTKRVRLEAGIGLPGFERVLADRARPFVRAAEVRIPELFVLGAEVVGHVETGDGRRVDFKADLVERVDGTLRLTDYKTGKTFAQQKQRETREAALAARVAKGEELQAVAYALGADEADAHGRYLFLKPDLDADLAELGVDAGNLSVARDFERVVRTVLAAWDAGSFFPRLVEPERDVEPRHCEQCDVSQACLRGDSGARRRLFEGSASLVRPDSEVPASPAGRPFVSLWRIPISDAETDAAESEPRQ
jgi:RecB family exonuclease